MEPHRAQTNVQLYTQLIRAGWREAELASVAAAYRLAMPAFAGRFRPDGRPFLAHLVGVASLVAIADPVAADRDRRVVAALLHALFEQGAQPNRAAAVAAVGEPAIRLVERYDRLGWNEATIRRLAAAPDPALADVLLLRLANEAEDHWDGTGAFSGKVRYADHPARVGWYRQIAEGAGLPILADWLEAGLAAGQALAPPDPLLSGMDRSFTLAVSGPPRRHPLDWLRRRLA